MVRGGEASGISGHIDGAGAAGRLRTLLRAYEYIFIYLYMCREREREREKSRERERERNRERERESAECAGARVQGLECRDVAKELPLR